MREAFIQQFTSIEWPVFEFGDSVSDALLLLDALRQTIKDNPQNSAGFGWVYRIQLATAENALLAFDPTSRMVRPRPISRARMLV